MGQFKSNLGQTEQSSLFRRSYFLTVDHKCTIMLKSTSVSRLSVSDVDFVCHTRSLFLWCMAIWCGVGGVGRAVLGWWGTHRVL